MLSCYLQLGNKHELRHCQLPIAKCRFPYLNSCSTICQQNVYNCMFFFPPQFAPLRGCRCVARMANVRPAAPAFCEHRRNAERTTQPIWRTPILGRTVSHRRRRRLNVHTPCLTWQLPPHIPATRISTHFRFQYATTTPLFHLLLLDQGRRPPTISERVD